MSDASEPPIEVIARLPRSIMPSLVSADSKDDPEIQTVVAVRQGRHFLTTFHPELTDDTRFHEYFVRVFVMPGMPTS